MDLEPSLFDDLIHDIGERAQGVFLWVRLVVKSLRNGIINEDPVSLLQERLRAIPSDLEEFFEHILGSVERIYRSRMASTFLAAMRSPHQLELIHYYFLEQGNPTFGFEMPSMRWRHSSIQKRAAQTERRLNGRFKGLLEAASTTDISAQTKVDFLHRTLNDFLATKRMREKLGFWASNELNVFTGISKALIAESKFIERSSCPSSLKLAVELASQGAVETGNTADCFEVIDQAELEEERIRPYHTTCGLNCDIIRFAASIGYVEYLKYRVQRDGSLLDLNRILKHAIACPVSFDDTYELHLPSSIERRRTIDHYNDRSPPSVSSLVGIAIIPSLIKQLFEIGVDPNSVVDGASSWMTFADGLIRSLDGKQKDRYWAVLEMFLEQGVDVNMATGSWIGMLTRIDATLEDNLRTTLRYFKRLFDRGLNPNVVLRDTTLTTVFLRTLASDSLHLPIASQRIKHEILREFLQHGADISVVYLDRTPDGWLNCVCRELATRRSAWNDLLFPRLEQYRILLEHALDPNVTVQGYRTLWGGLVEAMRNGVQQRIHDVGSCQPVRDMLHMSLQYGADPHLFELQQLKIEAPVVVSFPHNDVDRATNRRVDHRIAQIKLQPFVRPRDFDLPKIRDPVHSNSPFSSAAQQARQVVKRDHRQVSHGGRGSDPKRVRFN
ncbi:uncharacterized protein J4E84_010668 [Alternaria hordeiaustralica]|uniref:uncharacterized protein n=1 Tax=Alternaria hordeiaustralica TaxID=1187925 RepID=UPI0020C1D10B|nr:uncharacterized protein J4E84_010668 [Alternaria hordeiaustralica]KAI4674293.1 hypothetical protein J4E84_010668 [Alternaria hordeiaustralica]